MTRIEVQLPDELHRRARRLAEARGISLADLLRQELERVLDQDAEPQGAEGTWRAPVVKGLGWKGLSHEEIKRAAQLDS